jgi:hypothetical protein
LRKIVRDVSPPVDMTQRDAGGDQVYGGHEILP